MLPYPQDRVKPAIQARWPRSETVPQRGVPTYVVLHDSTIDGIATTRPKTLGQLREIRGIGDAKLQHHEEELLGLVRAKG